MFNLQKATVFARDRQGFPKMSEDIDGQIKRKETELSFICQCMEELKNEFIKETVSFASEWYKKTTKEYVVKYSEISLGVKEEQIAKMNAQVNELVHDTEKIVKSELDVVVLWWHQRPSLRDSINQYLQVADKYPIILVGAFRHVLGRLGLILEEYKFNVFASGNTGSYAEFWFDKPRGDGFTSVPYYPHLFKWSGEMQGTIQKYHSQYLKAIALYTEIQKLKDEKKQHQAMNRWDSI